MNIINRYNIAIVFVSVLLCIGCAEKYDMPDGGYDNRLLSFTLSNDGNIYEGSITANDEVLITIPFETDLSTAKVEYRISELADILPKPQSVTNWNEDQVFNVISKSGVKRTYVVKILEQTEVSESDVLLTNDEDVKAFVKRGIERIEGSLIIGKPSGPDSISNIDALTLLKEVGYRIKINPTYKGKDLAGLRNLERCGSLIVNKAHYLEKISLPLLEEIKSNLMLDAEVLSDISMPRLLDVGGDISFNIPMITRIEFLSLRSAGSLELKCPNLNTLKLTKLQTIKKSFTFSELQELSIFNVKALKSVGENLVLQKVTSLGMIILPELSTVGGKIEISASGARDIHFPKLKSTGSFLIFNNQALKELSAPVLVDVENQFTLQGAGLQTLSNLSAVNIGGKLTLSELSMLQTTGDFFKNIKSVAEVELKNTLIDGVLDFSRFNMKKVTISSCANLSEVILPPILEEFSFSGTQSYKHPTITKIRGVKEVDKFSLTNYVVENLSDLSIPDLEKVNHSLSIRVANFKSVTFEELTSVKLFDINLATAWYKKDEPMEVIPLQVVSAPKLREAERISCNEPWLHTLDFPELTTLASLNVTCYWPFQKNDKMTDLNSMPKLNSLNSVSFQNLVAFKDYSFLKKVVENGSLTIFNTRNCLYSPTLDDLKEGKFVKP